MMDIQEARNVLRNGTTSYGQYVEASAVVYGEHMIHAHPGERPEPGGMRTEAIRPAVQWLAGGRGMGWQVQIDMGIDRLEARFDLTAANSQAARAAVIPRARS